MRACEPRVRLEASLLQPVSPLALELKRQRREEQGRSGKATGATGGACPGPQMRSAAADMFLLPLSRSSTSKHEATAFGPFQTSS